MSGRGKESGQTGALLTLAAKRPGQDATLFWSRVFVEGECWIWRGNRKRGYAIFRIRENGVKRNLSAPRWAYEYLKDIELPDHLILVSTCDNKFCVRPSHHRIKERISWDEIMTTDATAPSTLNNSA